MPDIREARSPIEVAWEKTECKVQLPEPEADYLALKGPRPQCFGSHRRFHRFYFRGKAIVERQGVLLGVYTKDISRQGIGFLSPLELMPQERIQLRAVGANSLDLTVTRCHRLAEQCFECGAKFVK
jgi:hypothetical protein